MKKVLLFVAAAVLMSAGAVQAETWKGAIADDMCAKKSKAMHTNRECVEKCVKGGAAYVFATGDKIFKIANQDFADLKVHAGHEVNLTGTMKDDTITVTKIEMPKAEKKEAPKK